MIRLVSRSALCCLAATLLATGAQGQQTAPRPPAPAPATAPAPNPAQLALARELIELTGLSRLVDPVLPSFGIQIRQRAVTRPELTKDLDEVLEGLKPELEQQRLLMVDTTTRLYASSFTEAELKDLVTFFKTPSGQRYLQLTPRILDQLEVESRRWGERTGEYVMTRVRAELSKRGHQL